MIEVLLQVVVGVGCHVVGSLRETTVLLVCVLRHDLVLLRRNLLEGIRPKQRIVLVIMVVHFLG